MLPRTFLQYWDLDYPDIARLTGVTRDTVVHWFSTGRSSRELPVHHCQRLATIYFLWRDLNRVPQDLLDEWCRLPEDLEQQS